MAADAFTLVLGGGGMKGLAHVGVLQALDEAGLRPSLVVGSSIGALVAATWATGMPMDEIVTRARAVRRRDVFQIAHMDMAFKRMRSPAVYRPEPLDALIGELVGPRTFRELPHRLLVNAADLNAGAQVLFGLPGLDAVRVADAVFASCALPGLFPPRRIGGRWYADGAVVDNLPVHLAAAANGRVPIMAVTLAATALPRQAVQEEGFAATYSRGFELVMQQAVESGLRGWREPPLVLVQPDVQHISMFAFDRTDELIEAGYRATRDVLTTIQSPLVLEAGVHPRRRTTVRVDAVRCIGCGLCAMWAPHVFRMQDGKAVVTSAEQHWSAIDGLFGRRCPTGAIVTD